MKKALLLALFSLIGMGLTLNFAYAQETHAPQVKVFNSQNGHEDLYFMAYSKDFKGGARVARGDFNNDGYGDIAVGAGLDGGPHVKIFDRNGREVWDVFPFPKDFEGGVDVAAGDIDGDKTDELIVSQFMEGQAWIKVYEVDNNKTVLNEFLAYSGTFKGGVRVAAGDIDKDGKDEIIAGAGFGGGPQVKVFELDGRTIMNIAPFHKDFRGGVDVASGDVNNDKIDEIIASQNYFGQAWVKTYKPNGQILGEFRAYPESFKGGANVSAADIDNDNEAEIITGTGQNGGPQVRAFKYWGKDLGKNFMAYSEDFRGGIDVTGGDLDQGKVEEIVTAPGKIAFETARYPYHKYIEITLSKQALKYFENGRKIDEYLISSGRTGPTPTGTFKIQRKALATLMAGPGYYLPGVPYVMGFLGPYTIHGTYWHHNFGHPMSHGCVNMYTPEAKILYEWADVGTPVVIHW